MRRLNIAIATVGCRANQADSGALVRHLDSRKVVVVDRFDRADWVIVNTCCVTREAERDCRKIVRRALRENKATKVVVVGCTVNAIPDFAAKLGGDLGDRVVLKPGAEGQPERLAAWIEQRVDWAPEVVDPPGGAPTHSERVLGRTRALLKIQNGCSHRCAYCIVPDARGPERSMPREQVLAAADRLKGELFAEVVLTGVQLGAWGGDLQGQPRLAELVVAVADRLAPGRLRISSIEPWSLDDGLLEAMAGHDRICPHLHLPLQSGDDRILAAMGRPYSIRDYLSLVERARRFLPDVSIGTDLLLGFPGEDSRAFDNTLQALAGVQPAYIHAFPFSPRPGTRAAAMPGAPARETAKARVRKIRALGAEAVVRYRRTQVGQIREVIIEERRDGVLLGLTDTFIPVVIDDRDIPPGTLVRGRLESGAENGRLRAVPANAD